MVKPIVITASRDQILRKIEGLVSPNDESSVEEEVKEILTEIAGVNENAMLSEDDTAELLHSRDIYHFQSEAVRQVRKFLTA